MSVVGRLTVRVFAYISYLFLGAAVITFILSDLKWLRATGIFLLLFLVDRFIHWREADKPLSELPASGSVNLASYLRPDAFSALEHAFQRSYLTRHNFFLEMVHHLLNFKEIDEGLRRLDVKPDEFKQKTEEILASGDNQKKLPSDEKLKQAERLIVQAFDQALKSDHRFIRLADLFSALSFVGDEKVERLFNLFSIDSGDLERALIFSSVGKLSSRRQMASVGGFVFESHRRTRHRVMNRAWTARPTSALDQYSTDFTDLARRRQIGFLVGHQIDYQRLVDTLARPTSPNVLLVGEFGVGKETLVAHLAFDLVNDKVPRPLFDKRLVALHLTNMVAGASPEELQKRLQTIIDEIYTAGNIILYIPDIHNLVKTSGTAYLSAADALLPIITNNIFPIIGSTYPKDFRESLESRSDFVGNFEIIRVQEISEAEAEKLLVYESVLFEKRSNVVVSFGAVKEAVRLAKKYFRSKLLPSSAEELLKDGLVEAQRRGDKFLGKDDIVRVAERKVNIPIHKAEATEVEALLNLEQIIHEQFINQEEAVKSVCSALREYRSGLTRRGGPIATFLFIGPTGVGKTELSKILARIQFGSENLMIRFDMSEYQDKQSFFRLIGSPDGKTSGALTDAVLQKPYSLILLDEFEKAYPDILNLFLQVFDEGRLTDNLGRIVDFQNTIIIATSNAHSEFIKTQIDQGQDVSLIAGALKKKLIDYFKPELLNRFSKIIVFTTLPPAALEAVAQLKLNELASILEEQGINLTFDPAVVKRVATLGYDPAFGARPLRQVIEEKLRSPLADKILKKEIAKGSQIKAVIENDEIQFVSASRSS